MAKENSARWVDERLAELQNDRTWQPDVDRALAEVRARTTKERAPGAAWTWLAATVAAACICLLVFPESRDVVRHMWGVHHGPGPVDVGQVSADLSKVAAKQAAPNFTLKDASGHDVHLSDFKGKVVLINFWATWCVGCQTEIPWLVEFDQKYRDKGLAVIGVSMDEDGWKTLSPYLKQKGVSYTVVIGDDDMANAYGMIGMPMTYLIGRDGKVSAVSAGVVDKTTCETEITHLLAN
jgi:peroxiredoxin